ncbi:MAG: SPFH domain-containing protein [Gammaproteobacteria bacterium]|nr:SPFH domain-containing protein [Gammaproteobacteria bacterium]NIR98633.1 SPFH domain-containing protein [Gammaproteobacteria bacterium]NIT64356.1 SPFH domain-containing protein [Gammaproteobacteria bacterium]NIV21280.1 SPFH domain-containing protein [Gammaproteobacteria bacterium]NIX10984.1 SPFH domain-containing protein [Gammaproteobacteria bacterium]
MNIKYYKGEPSTYVLRYRRGRLVGHGAGLTFWYLPYQTTIAAIPVVSQDAPFIFTESTKDFQEVSIQGQLTYRVDKPLEVAKALDFTLDPKTGHYRGKGLEKLVQRVINAVQANTRYGVNTLSLEEALTRVKELSGDVLAAVAALPALSRLGIVVESLHFAAVTATPEMRKALEADYRESLQRRADQAIYARRHAAVEEESKISHRELDTEVELEERRRDLVDLQARNQLALAEAEGRAEELKLNPYGAIAPQALVGMALKEWAANAGTIGSLSISPDLLGKLVGWIGDRSHERGA